MSCPAQCQLCEDRNGTVLCLKCAIGLYEVINQSGFCSASCARTEYSDNNTRRCYACITPCVSCSSAIACKSCIAGYLLCSDQCIAGENCPEGYFKYHNSCLSGCPDQLWSDTSSRLCLE